MSGFDEGANRLDVKATATTGVIRGVVVDQAIRPIQGASIVVASENKNATSNDQGAFAFEGLAPGTYFLTVSHWRHTTVQTSAEVVAGVSNPNIVRVLLEALPYVEPSYEVLQRDIFLDASACVGTCLSCCSFLFNADTATTYEGLHFSAAVGTRFVQVLTVWEATSSTAEGAMLYTWLYDADGGNVEFLNDRGPSPFAQEFRASALDDMLDAPGPLEIRGSIWANTLDPGVGLAVQQAYHVYAVATVHFEPPEGYRFDVDGPPTLPQ